MNVVHPKVAVAAVVGAVVTAAMAFLHRINLTPPEVSAIATMLMTIAGYLTPSFSRSDPVPPPAPVVSSSVPAAGATPPDQPSVV